MATDVIFYIIRIIFKYGRNYYYGKGRDVIGSFYTQRTLSPAHWRMPSRDRGTGGLQHPLGCDLNGPLYYDTALPFSHKSILLFCVI